MAAGPLAADLDLVGLAAYLGPRVDGGLAGPLRGRLLAGGRSNPTYEVDDGVRQWIVRRPPYGDVMASTHDMGRESRVIRALHGSSVPVPAVVARCADPSVIGADFYVMEKVDGRTYRTREDTRLLAPDQRAELSRSLVDTLVALHTIDPAAVGLADFGRPDGYLERQLSRWRRQWEKVRTRDLPAFDSLADFLTRSIPDRRLPGIVHGDYKIDNLMVDHADPSRIVAVLDWEMATLGDTLADVGMLLSFWDEPALPYNPITAGATALPGFPDRRGVLSAYAERRGIDLGDIEWYVIFSDFKLMVILEQIHARHLEGATVGEGFADIDPMVPALLERALARKAESGDPPLRG
ncbi:phosphotransferase family protein [Frankia sp. CNm7]|uniref:Phosphotransferase family protein n=1 Tax=Frankia nepalensis TaxID=1836974 RepID=A0A937UL31_9ACTN|nr:phosphotransferase family protein [Frankia nepalensis]MBL7496680.1 phosphotransferase family protein [Frankia nepalensis]MBL7510678.1 phosphotransferase family protein [Frankia nepalensis]MBL7516689.1 phosphotransferase family protein [Frankia nepalensis]MBL7627419.1 phosphotransferase family protein [Frankia nepalensis]